MDRRKALKSIGIGFGAITATSSVVSLFQSCQKSSNWSPVFLSNEEFDIVSKLMDLIIPTTDIPGAIDLKLPEFGDAYISAVFDNNAKEMFKNGLNEFINKAKSETGKSSVKSISIKEWDDQLDKYLKSDLEVNKEAKSFAIRLRRITVQAFRINEYIAENILAYDPVPGRQEGCVDLEQATGGKAWSI